MSETMSQAEAECIAHLASAMVDDNVMVLSLDVDAARRQLADLIVEGQGFGGACAAKEALDKFVEVSEAAFGANPYFDGLRKMAGLLYERVEECERKISNLKNPLLANMNPKDAGTQGAISGDIFGRLRTERGEKRLKAQFADFLSVVMEEYGWSPYFLNMGDLFAKALKGEESERSEATLEEILSDDRATEWRYAPLRHVLDEAYARAACGKGRERHADGLPFDQQPIIEIAVKAGMGFLLGQIAKKALEVPKLEGGERKDNEMLDIAVYACAAVIARRLMGERFAGESR